MRSKIIKMITQAVQSPSECRRIIPALLRMVSLHARIKGIFYNPSSLNLGLYKIEKAH
jgi:hypothetical protein